MNENRRIQSRFTALHSYAIKRKQVWELERAEFKEWVLANRLLAAPMRVYVQRDDPAKPWKLDNLIVSDRPGPARHQRGITTLTKGEWIEELRSAQSPSDAK